MRIWQESEFWGLFFGVVLAYFVGMQYPSLRGEETRWAEVANNIRRTGDWLIPRQQGVPFLSRPPLQSWVMVLASEITGEVDVVAIRLGSGLSVLLTSVLLYAYGRLFLSSTGALAAGLAYATMAHVLKLGRLAESDAMFTLFISSSLMVWHWGYVRKWGWGAPWIAGYSLAALGALVKMAQAPVYFAASTTVYLLLRRDFRTIFSLGHLAGILSFFLVFGAWFGPFLLSFGPDGFQRMFIFEVQDRFRNSGIGVYVRHMLEYPGAVLGACLPWSILLVGYQLPAIRGNLGAAAPLLGFACTCLAVTFPTLWPVPRAMARYFMPMYPMLALLSAIVVERMASGEISIPWLARLRRPVSIILAGAAGAIVGIHFLQPSAGALYLPYVATSLAWGTVLLVIGLWLFQDSCLRSVKQSLYITALFVVAANLAGYLPYLHAQTGEATEQIHSLRAALPEPDKLASIGPIHHWFAYHYGQPIRQLPRSSNSIPEELEYFCFSKELFGGPPPLSFEWETVTEIACDRTKVAAPAMLVVVGRRVRGDANLVPALPVSRPASSDSKSDPDDR